MELLKQRIRRDGTVKGTDVLKVDSFLNHQMDVELFAEIGKEFLRRFEGCGVNKILTIEASGIGIACVTAQFFHCPVIFAKKSQSKNIDGAVYSLSLIHISVSERQGAKSVTRPLCSSIASTSPSSPVVTLSTSPTWAV